MSPVESAGLALCADKFMIPRLVQKALKRLKPTGAEDIFPALICVTYANFPDLETQVCKIIQQETDKVVVSADFLKLDEASVLFILKQNTLKIDEVELWKHVVRWAEHQKNPTRNVRDCLTKILGNVRFLTFTSDDILDHVLPTEALSPEEFMDLSLAVRKNQPLKSSLLCDVREKRNIYQGEEMEGQNIEEKIEDKVDDDESKVSNNSEKECAITVFDKKCCCRAHDYYDIEWEYEYSLKSSLTIIPHEPIEIESFICDRGEFNLGDENYCCNITVENKSSTDFIQQLNSVVGSATYPHDIVIPLKFNSGVPIKMNPNEKWKFTISWEEEHSANHLKSSDETCSDVDVTENQLNGEDLTVIYDGPFHVYEIIYRKQ